MQVTYVLQAPGGTWDVLDFGDYLIKAQPGTIKSAGGKLIQDRDVGKFNVRIVVSTVLYVSTFSDSLGDGSLRDAIKAANAVGQPRTIILDSGTYKIGIAPVRDPQTTFAFAPASCKVPTTRRVGLIRILETMTSQGPSPSLAIKTT